MTGAPVSEEAVRGPAGHNGAQAASEGMDAPFHHFFESEPAHADRDLTLVQESDQPVDESVSVEVEQEKGADHNPQMGILQRAQDVAAEALRRIRPATGQAPSEYHLVPSSSTQLYASAICENWESRDYESEKGRYARSPPDSASTCGDIWGTTPSKGLLELRLLLGTSFTVNHLTGFILGVSAPHKRSLRQKVATENATHEEAPVISG